MTARAATLVASAVLALVLAVLGARLALTVLALPPALWLEEIASPRPGDVALAREARPAAERLSWRGRDRDVLWGRYLTCRAEGARAAPASFQAPPGERCRALLRAALEAGPAAPRQWLELARLDAAAHGVGAEALDALRMSYRTGAREGWVAAPRAAFGLRCWPALPDALRAAVADDIALVADVWRLNFPLLDAYIADPFVRLNAGAALQAVDRETAETFVRMVRRRMRGES